MKKRKSEGGNVPADKTRPAMYPHCVDGVEIETNACPVENFVPQTSPRYDWKTGKTREQRADIVAQGRRHQMTLKFRAKTRWREDDDAESSMRPMGFYDGDF